MRKNGSVVTLEESENDRSSPRHVRIVGKPYDYEALSAVTDIHAIFLISLIPAELLV